MGLFITLLIFVVFIGAIRFFSDRWSKSPAGKEYWRKQIEVKALNEKAAQDRLLAAVGKDYKKNLVAYSNKPVSPTSDESGKQPGQKIQRGWLFYIRPILGILSYPFLFIGVIGLGLEFSNFLSSGPEKDYIYEHFGQWLGLIALAGGLFLFGLLLRWIATNDSLSVPTRKVRSVSNVDPNKPKLSGDPDKDASVHSDVWPPLR
jgi:hypothetical protein